MMQEGKSSYWLNVQSLAVADDSKEKTASNTHRGKYHLSHTLCAASIDYSGINDKINFEELQVGSFGQKLGENL